MKVITIKFEADSDKRVHTIIGEIWKVMMDITGKSSEELLRDKRVVLSCKKKDNKFAIKAVINRATPAVIRELAPVVFKHGYHDPVSMTTATKEN